MRGEIRRFVFEMRVMILAGLWLGASLFTPSNLLASEVFKSSELPKKVTFNIYDLKSDKLLYKGVETVSSLGSEVTRKTSYFAGEKLVQSEVVRYDFSTLAVAHYSVKNPVAKEDIDVDLKDGKYQVKINDHGKITEKSFPYRKDLYLGKVLHHLKVRNWTKLQEGPLVFDLFIPFMADYFKFQIVKLDSDKKYPNLTKLLLRPDSWLIRGFVDEITFYYDSKSRRVAHYEGPSNIKEAGIEKRLVRIDFVVEP